MNKNITCLTELHFLGQVGVPLAELLPRVYLPCARARRLLRQRSPCALLLDTQRPDREVVKSNSWKLLDVFFLIRLGELLRCAAQWATVCRARRGLLPLIRDAWCPIERDAAGKLNYFWDVEPSYSECVCATVHDLCPAACNQNLRACVCERESTCVTCGGGAVCGTWAPAPRALFMLNNAHKRAWKCSFFFLF